MVSNCTLMHKMLYGLYITRLQTVQQTCIQYGAFGNETHFFDQKHIQIFLLSRRHALLRDKKWYRCSCSSTSIAANLHWNCGRFGCSGSAIDIHCGSIIDKSVLHRKVCIYTHNGTIPCTPPYYNILLVYESISHTLHFCILRSVYVYIFHLNYLCSCIFQPYSLQVEKETEGMQPVRQSTNGLTANIDYADKCCVTLCIITELHARHYIQ